MDVDPYVVSGAVGEKAVGRDTDVGADVATEVADLVTSEAVVYEVVDAEAPGSVWYIGVDIVDVVDDYADVDIGIVGPSESEDNTLTGDGAAS